MTDVPFPALIPEKRFSRKIILGKLSRFLPSGMKRAIALFRFITFPQRCTGVSAATSAYTDGSWVERKVTKDQEAIERYLELQSISGKRILHVGVGSSSIAKKFGTRTEVIDGVTVVQEEKDYGDRLGIASYRVFLLNKYGPELPTLSGNYDFVVDNDLAGYAPCKDAFESMLNTYLKMLAPDGIILTGIRGLSYFDNGFPLPDFYLKRLSNKLSFSVERGETFLALRPI